MDVVYSDKNSPCCKGCQLMASGQKCREAQRATCELEAKCTGGSAECPASAPQPDGTECLEKGKCRNGTCLPFCETQNYQVSLPFSRQKSSLRATSCSHPG